jgi:hypothetical protein
MAGDEEDDSHMTMKRRQKRRPVQPQLDAILPAMPALGVLNRHRDRPPNLSAFACSAISISRRTAPPPGTLATPQSFKFRGLR